MNKRVRTRVVLALALSGGFGVQAGPAYADPLPHPTSTTVTCLPNTVEVGQSTTCTAQVMDTTPGGMGNHFHAPTGTVTWGSSGVGTFSSTTCNLPGGGGRTKSCSVTYTPTAVGTGSHSITATYPGDGNHTGSFGSTTVTVTPAQPAAPATVIVTPATDTNTAGDEHCVTATVADAFGNPTSGVEVFFSVTGANTDSGSDTTDAAGEADFCYTGTTAGEDAITAVADADGDGTPQETEPTGAATKTWTPAAPATVILSPATATNEVGTSHTVTATVTDAFGNPTPGISVQFTVTGAVSTSGECTTEADGQCEFTYEGPELPGEDAITAFADTNGDGDQDLDEPAGAATKTWVVPPSTPLCETKITEGVQITAVNGDRATAGGNAKVNAQGNPKGQMTYTDHGPAQAMKVKSTKILAVVCSADRHSADVFGEANVTGFGSGKHIFKVELEDNGDPGTNDRYRILLTNGYDSGDQQLEGGNIQIR
jgi:uncharacterized protein (DUF2141 family)